MSSHIYETNSKLQQQQLDILSTIDKESPQKVEKTTKKALFLHHSNSKSNHKNRSINRGSESISAFQTSQLKEGVKREAKEKSLKIDCCGPAVILANMQELNYEYSPLKKKANVQHTQSFEIKAPQIDCEYIKENEDDGGQNQIKQNQLQGKDEKKLDKIYFFIFLTILLWLLCQQTRQVGFKGYSMIGSAVI